MQNSIRRRKLHTCTLPVGTEQRLARCVGASIHYLKFQELLAYLVEDGCRSFDRYPQLIFCFEKDALASNFLHTLERIPNSPLDEESKHLSFFADPGCIFSRSLRRKEAQVL